MTTTIHFPSLKSLRFAALSVFWLIVSCRFESKVVIDTVSPETTEIRQTLKLLGRMHSATRMVIGAPYDGHVEILDVASGQTVEKGQRLFLMKSKDLEEKIDQGKREIQSLILQKSSQTAELQKASLDLKRSETAFRSRAISSSEVDERRVQTVLAQHRIKSTELEVLSKEKVIQTLQEQMAARQAVSPMVGLVSETWVPQAEFTRGTVVKAGDPLVTLIENEEMKMKASVSEQFAFQVTEGQQMKVYSPAQPELTWTGTVQSVKSIPDREGMFEVVVKFRPEPGKLRIGSELIAATTTAYKNSALTIPKTAVMKVGDEYFVSLVSQTKNGVKTERRKVALGLIGDDRVELLSGLEPRTNVARVFQ